MKGKEREENYHPILRFLIIRLIKQEVRRQLLVFIAGEIGLDDLIPRETEPAEPFDGVAFFFRDGDGDGVGGHGAGVAHSCYAFAAADVLEKGRGMVSM